MGELASFTFATVWEVFASLLRLAETVVRDDCSDGAGYCKKWELSDFSITDVRGELTWWQIVVFLRAFTRLDAMTVLVLAFFVVTTSIFVVAEIAGLVVD